MKEKSITNGYQIMNERIKELRRQATLVETHTSHDGSVHEGKSVDLEKFAELIVKECVAICEDTDGEHIADAKWGRRCCALEIREHFGVEL
jgi:hypothetical protein